jgi:hypothetical protein
VPAEEVGVGVGGEVGEVGVRVVEVGAEGWVVMEREEVVKGPACKRFTPTAKTLYEHLI